jgi:hypothetical protein
MFSLTILTRMWDLLGSFGGAHTGSYGFPEHPLPGFASNPAHRQEGR